MRSSPDEAQKVFLGAQAGVYSEASDLVQQIADFNARGGLLAGEAAIASVAFGVTASFVSLATVHAA